MSSETTPHDGAPLPDVTALFATPARIKALENAIASDRHVEVTGLAGSAIAMLAARMPVEKAPYLIIDNDYDAAGYLYHDLSRLIDLRDAVKIFPSGYRRDIKYGQADAANRILRTDVLESWDPALTRWVVSYPEALAEKVAAPAEIQARSLILSKGEKIRMKAVRSRLDELGFEAVDYVYEPGQYAVRGSILDVFSYSRETPFRLDFFDDEVDSIRSFDVETQLSTETAERVCIVPDVTASEAAEVSLLDYIDTDTVIFCRSVEWLCGRVRAMGTQSVAAQVAITGQGDPEAMRHVVDPEAFLQRLKAFRIVEYGQHESKGNIAATTLDFPCTPQALYHKNFDLISESFSRLLKENYKLFILSDSSHQADRLRAIFAERGDRITFTPVAGTIHEGFADIQHKICFFTDHQIFDRFHKFNLRSDRARSGKLAMTLRELGKLEVGDYVVHADHGIGRFGGLVRTDVAGKLQEMIKLFYANDDIIFVSIHSLHKLSKYRSAEGEMPRLSKLGSGAWERLKARTKKKVKDIARDLIRLYASRLREKGHAYSPDSYLQHELEASFIYEDTPDQVKAVAAVKADMESEVPMDRLVCGDVGFGKTEVAIRAAFKAAVDGKQTAVLVPTTVLALQHYNTFSERLKDMPVRVEFISRAKKPKEIKQILIDLKEGKIDILIGTHRIIGKDVVFHDLGLLIIDEEQKFGVTVKEKLKQLRVNVDTLTMSATPIPRTLQFSLMGARDLSNLTTPPANRRPVMTTVAPMTDEVIAEAIRFELSRNGQIFFICNRIERMEYIATKLKRLVPDLRIATGHGKIPPEQLEKTIMDFTNHDYDLLIATTIVENGIDMPNVNTIMVDNAQNFGLSELHQLRGRVGRSARKAFAYLFVPAMESLTPVARRRLQAIEAFSDLGAGIHIAMQDLDIRGAGNLLGAEQSGFIADLGFETYQRILKESVIELRGETFAGLPAQHPDTDGHTEEFVADCTVESDMELLIPMDYVPQENERITLYRQLDTMETPEQLNAFRAMLRDRFGTIPAVTEQLIAVVELRAAAKALGVERLHLKGGKMYLYFVDAANLAYYRSAAFGRILTYYRTNARRSQLREIKERRSMVISSVTSVTDALSILSLIGSLPVS